MDFAKIVVERLDELGLNVNQAEARARLPQGYIRGVIRQDTKRATPNIEKASIIADALGLELYLGPPRQDRPCTPGTDPQMFVQIPFSSAMVSAGTGQMPQEEVSHFELSFRAEWLKNLGVSALNAVLCRVTGDSMSPTIKANDIVLIDTSKSEVRVRKRSKHDRRPSEIYALRDENGARIKRIERPETDLLILSSDNSSYPPEAIHSSGVADLGIIGRVVWWGHTNRE